jgi:glucose-6-phosphate 1-dehydrogenase
MVIMKLQERLHFDFILFGGSGDLALRKLLPAWYRRFRHDSFHPDTRIIGVARGDLSRQEYQQRVTAALEKYLDAEWSVDIWQAFSAHIFYVSLDATQADHYHALATLLGEQYGRPRIYYLSTHASLYGQITQQLQQAGLVSAHCRLVIEKPIGRDLATANAINAQVAEVFKEDQVYRIDHYLGKETVQNLLVLRFANPLFESLWNHQYIDHIQITIAESIGVESRGDFYENTGALRDIVQNHLLQLLCIVAMEPPPSRQADRIRDEKLKVLRSLKPLSADRLAGNVVRGQYGPGVVNQVHLGGYLNEESVAEDSKTETFVALKLEISNMRWAGVPFYLRTGKRLAQRLCEIVVQFREIPHSIFNMPSGQLMSNQLVITLQPNESITLRLLGKRFGPGMEVRQLDLNLNPTVRGDKQSADAYERLLVDVIKGDQTLFLRQDELEEAWRWVEPILNGWEDSAAPPDQYPAGSWGPSAATLLLARDGRLWHEDTH